MTECLVTGCAGRHILLTMLPAKRTNLIFNVFVQGVFSLNGCHTRAELAASSSSGGGGPEGLSRSDREGQEGCSAESALEWTDSDGRFSLVGEGDGNERCTRHPLPYLFLWVRGNLLTVSAASSTLCAQETDGNLRSHAGAVECV